MRGLNVYQVIGSDVAQALCALSSCLAWIIHSKDTEGHHFEMWPGQEKAFCFGSVVKVNVPQVWTRPMHSWLSHFTEWMTKKIVSSLSQRTERERLRRSKLHKGKICQSKTRHLGPSETHPLPPQKRERIKMVLNCFCHWQVTKRSSVSSKSVFYMPGEYLIVQAIQHQKIFWSSMLPRLETCKWRKKNKKPGNDFTTKKEAHHDLFQKCTQSLAFICN